MYRFTRCLMFVSLGCWFLSLAVADDWNQWRGVDRDGVWNESNILTEFPDEGPQIIWKSPVANGYAGPAVADGKVFVADFVKEKGDDTPDPGKKSELIGTERSSMPGRQNGRTTLGP